MQTYARLALPFKPRRTSWRFGSKRRFVATIEWLRWFPKPGFFPQMAQTLDIRRRSVARELSRCAGERPHLGEDVGHLERGARRVAALAEPRLRLLDRVDGEDA